MDLKKELKWGLHAFFWGFASYFIFPENLVLGVIYGVIAHCSIRYLVDEDLRKKYEDE